MKINPDILKFVNDVESSGEFDWIKPMFDKIWDKADCKNTTKLKERRNMNTHQLGKRVCCICGAEGKEEGFDLPALTFNYLEGNPCICEKCVFEMLTNIVVSFQHPEVPLNRDWKPSIKQHLKEK